jgi:hypothetical protein
VRSLRDRVINLTTAKAVALGYFFMPAVAGAWLSLLVSTDGSHLRVEDGQDHNAREGGGCYD